MRRREFIAALGGAVTWPLAARGEQPSGARRIGVLMSFAEDDTLSKEALAGFQQGLEGFGWSEGRNLRIEYRFGAGRVDQFQALAKELVATQPDMILAQGTASTAALQRQSSAIPIVFVAVSDPIGSGFVASLARPGSNLTGLLMYEGSITGKWLAMLKEIAPHLARVGLLVSPSTAYDYFVQAATAAAAALPMELVPSRVENVADIEHAIESFARMPNGGLLLPPDSLTVVHRDLVIMLAARYRLPAVYGFRVFVTDGGLMSYGTDPVGMYRQLASYVDRILRGAKPTDLPVEAPTKYQMVLNLKTAKALGLDVPPSLMVRADEVIE
jgi:putative ABC transport system substrate-binding protein